MLNSSLTGSLRSLNEVNAKPKRTSYGNMSTWFFMDNVDRGSDLDKSYMNLNEFNSASSHLPNDFTLPALEKNRIVRSRLQSARETAKSPIVRDFLMKNWSDKRHESNKLFSTLVSEKEIRKGRSGSGGVWSNITEAFKEDGNRLLFIEGPAYNKVHHFQSNVQNSSRLDPYELPKMNSQPRVSSALKDKLQRERHGVQTKHGVDAGNWNVMR